MFNLCCLCIECYSFVDLCPICRVVKSASVYVFILRSYNIINPHQRCLYGDVEYEPDLLFGKIESMHVLIVAITNTNLIGVLWQILYHDENIIKHNKLMRQRKRKNKGYKLDCINGFKSYV